jgi:hypothetical protein
VVRSIGLDVHRDFCEVAILDSCGGRARGRIATTTPDDLELFAQSLGPADHVALELTGNGNAWEIARIIEPHVARVIVVSPSDTGIRQARAKTDRLDAQALAKLLARSRPRLAISTTCCAPPGPSYARRTSRPGCRPPRRRADAPTEIVWIGFGDLHHGSLIWSAVSPDGLYQGEHRAQVPRGQLAVWIVDEYAILHAEGIYSECEIRNALRVERLNRGAGFQVGILDDGPKLGVRRLPARREVGTPR